MADCLFCKMVSKDIDADIVHESDDLLAFRDINPQAPTHILVIPKEHIAAASDLTGDSGNLLGSLFATIARLASDEGLTNGWRVVTNVGPEAGQSVQHLHFHLIGGRQMSWPPG